MKRIDIPGTDVSLVSPKLMLLKPVLHRWTELVIEYSDSLQDDACYWYTERANVGILAAAAWSTGKWIALEEYSTTKRGSEEETRIGRCDLFLHKKGSDFSCAIEAKLAWQNIGNTVRDSCSEIRNKFLGDTGAWTDTARLDQQEATIRIAACFAVSQLPLSQVKSHDEVTQRVNEWIGAVRKMDSWGAIAWAFPKEPDRMAQARGKVYPGVCLLLKQWHR